MAQRDCDQPKRMRPELVVISEAGAFPLIDLLELCVEKQLPFIMIHDANSDAWWIDDHAAGTALNNRCPVDRGDWTHLGDAMISARFTIRRPSQMWRPHQQTESRCRSNPAKRG
jgi:hypothetical protein